MIFCYVQSFYTYYKFVCVYLEHDHCLQEFQCDFFFLASVSEIQCYDDSKLSLDFSSREQRSYPSASQILAELLIICFFDCIFVGVSI